MHVHASPAAWPLLNGAPPSLRPPRFLLPCVRRLLSPLTVPPCAPSSSCSSRLPPPPIPSHPSVRLDFSHLPPEARLRDKKNRERWERERLAEIEECREQMARLAPNLKVRRTKR